MPDLLAHLQALEAEPHHPGVRCSRARLEELLHPEFHEVGRSGKQYTRETVIRHLAAEPARPNVVATDYGVRELAQGVALLTYRSAHCGQDGSLSLRALRSSIWMEGPVGWQLLYHQGTPDPETGADGEG